MKEKKQTKSFWKPYFIWLLSFVILSFVIGLIFSMLIEAGILSAFDQSNPQNLGIILSNLSLIGLSFIGILLNPKKPFIWAGLTVVSIFSLNPIGSIFLYLLSLCLAIGIRWAFAKFRTILAYYSPQKSYPDAAGQRR